MTVNGMWAGLSRAQIAERRAKNAPRWQRHWRGRLGRDAPQRKQFYKEHQKAQAYRTTPPRWVSRRPGRSAVTRSPSTPRGLRRPRGLDPGHHRDRDLECAPGVAAETRKKRVEIMRAAIKRGIRDKLVDSGPTKGVVVYLGHRELPSYSSEQLMTIYEAAPNHSDRALIGVWA